MRKFILEIECENDVFGSAPTFEVARILRELATNVEDNEVMEGSGRKRLRDDNGNTVGFAEFVDLSA